MRDNFREEYFNWLFDIVCAERYSKRISYKKLLRRLHEIEFIYSHPKDQNRAEDGVDMRRRFILDMDYEQFYNTIICSLDGPCSVLEMMIALAVRCEEHIMDDPNIGNRTGQWFWGMVVNLGLGAVTDERFDSRLVDERIGRFLSRDYEPNGRGGLFTVRNCKYDLRDVEIWYQLCWYLDDFC